jgi:hypothetical protein
MMGYEFEQYANKEDEMPEQPSLAQLINAANNEYDERTQERHDEGADKYGPLKFLTVNTLEEAMQEVLDLGNYARYTYIRLWLLNHMLDDAYGEDAPQNITFYTNRPDVVPPADIETPKGEQ